MECKHENTVLNTSGGMHFDEGSVWDDIKEELFCLDCRQIIPVEEVPSDNTEEIPF